MVGQDDYKGEWMSLKQHSLLVFFIFYFLNFNLVAINLRIGKTIAAYGNDTVYVVNTGNDVLKWNPTRLGWELVASNAPSSLRQIDCLTSGSVDTLIGTKNDNTVWTYNGTDWVQEQTGKAYEWVVIDRSTGRKKGLVANAPMERAWEYWGAESGTGDQTNLETLPFKNYNQSSPNHLMVLNKYKNSVEYHWWRRRNMNYFVALNSEGKQRRFDVHRFAPNPHYEGFFSELNAQNRNEFDIVQISADEWLQNMWGIDEKGSVYQWDNGEQEWILRSEFIGRSPFRFVSKKSSLILHGDGESQLYLRKDLDVRKGNVRMLGEYTDELVQGTGHMNFERGTLESGTAELFLTAQYNPANGDSVYLSGGTPNVPDRLRVQPGMVVERVYVEFADNYIEGQPQFTESIVFDGYADTQLYIAIQNTLNKNINVNNGTLILADDLSLARGVVLDRDQNGTPTAGTVVLNKRTLNFPGALSEWSGNLKFKEATDMQLHATTSLDGQWTFTRANACGIGDEYEDAYLNGNGNILDLTSGGTLWIEPGIRLHLVDIHVRGLGDSDALGKIILDPAKDACPQAQLRLYNAEIDLSGNYTVTHGGWYVDGADSTILSGSYFLTFTGYLDNYATLTVDGVSLWWDNRGLALERTIVPLGEDRIHLEYVNGGYIVSNLADQEETEFDAAITDSGLLYENYAIDASRPLLVKNSASPVLKGFLLDGQGYYLYFPVGSSLPGSVDVCANITVTFKNVTLKNFSPEGISIGTNSELYFGDGVTIELESNQVISNRSLYFASLGQAGAAQIIGNGNTLTLNRDEAIFADSFMTVTLKDLRIEGLGLYEFELMSSDSTTQFDLVNTILLLEHNFTFTRGNLNIFGNVVIRECDVQPEFVFSSTGELTIYNGAKLLIDREVIFKYASAEPANDNLIIANGGQFHLNGATLYATTTGLHLKGYGSDSRLIIQNNVTFHSESDDPNQAIIIDKDLPIEVMVDGELNFIGPVTYE